MFLSQLAKTIISISLVVGFVVAANIIYAWSGPTAPPTQNNTAAPILTDGSAQTKSGGLSVNTLGSGGEITATLNGYGQFRMIGGGYGALWRNDGSNTWFLLTNANDQYGGWNGLRPFYVNDSSGAVNIDTQLCLQGVCKNAWTQSSNVYLYQCPNYGSGSCYGQYELGQTNPSCYSVSCTQNCTTTCGCGCSTSCTTSCSNITHTCSYVAAAAVEQVAQSSIRSYSSSQAIAAVHNATGLPAYDSAVHDSPTEEQQACSLLWPGSVRLGAYTSSFNSPGNNYFYRYSGGWYLSGANYDPWISTLFCQGH